MRDDAFWASLVTMPALLDIVEEFLGPDIACFTSHYICKPPGDGHAVLWHQDAGYWKLEPLRAITVSVAINPSTVENGCLWMVPGSHRLPLCCIKLRTDEANMLGSVVDLDAVPPEQTELANLDRQVPVELQPGDVSIHPLILHHSHANRSARRRGGLDIGYTDTGVQIMNEGLYENPIVCRGSAKPGINRYRAWPTYHPEFSMTFCNRAAWDLRAAAANRLEYVQRSSADEPAYTMVQRMMRRIDAGTVRA